MLKILANKSVFFNLFVIVFSFIILLNFGCVLHKSTLKPDHKLIDEFQAKKDTLNRLIQMLKEDNLLAKEGKIYLSEEKLRKQGIKEERIQAYQNLYREYCPKCSTAFTESYSPSKGLEFPSPIWGDGYSYQDDYSYEGDRLVQSKGFVWFDDDNQPETVRNLDSYYYSRGWDTKKNKNFMYYRHIEGNWYLFLNCWSAPEV